MATPESDQPATIYQLKITLDRSDPPIWRRVQIEDCDLTTLHQVIQSAMGWENDHMHEFEIGKKKYVGNPMQETRDEDTGETTRLSEIVAQGAQEDQVLVRLRRRLVPHDPDRKARFRRSRAYTIPAASKASEPARPRTAAASGGTTGSSTR